MMITVYGDGVDANNIENALAHRGLLRDDDLYAGWSYTPDRAVATYSDLENCNFWLRHYDGATGSWTSPVNLSNITDKGINVREPRLVDTPSGAGQDTSAFVVAWVPRPTSRRSSAANRTWRSSTRGASARA